ncbi:MAG TPA: class I SAM-dependent methyltransferase [Hyphomicrobiaceae bacterium]|nr:class I SAM-dependent methyltransferase [Hyphomicrobiaceae bacterium]
MANTLGAAAQIAGQTLRFGWYLGLNRLVEVRSRGRHPTPRPVPARPVPTRAEILADLAQLYLRDAQAVRDGIYPPSVGEEGPLESFERARALLADLPHALERRQARDATTAKAEAEAAAAALPDYYAQDFHFQTGGYLTEGSARLYDMQVETLFLGGAAAMRREALRPVAEYMRGRDQRHVVLLDVACGTGRLLRQVRLAWPAMQLKGLDLSRPYLDEARRHLNGLRAVEWIEAAAERMPLVDASVDIACSTFLYHELPPEVRRAVTAEIARVLKPGGVLVFLDSLQMGDRPDWDGLLEAFPARFHEPYYRHYAIDDLDGMFADAGLVAVLSWTSHLAKVMVRRKG